MTARAPLAGQRIVVTRPLAQAGALADKLAALGAEPIMLPMIEIAPLDDLSELDAALQRLIAYDWVIFTSVNAVAIFWDRLAGPLPATVRRAAVGPATACALETRGAPAAFIPAEFVAEALAAGIGDMAGQRCLLPQAELAREALADDLRRRGAVVDEVAIYRTLPAALDPRGLAAWRRGVDAVTFTSASAVRNFARLLGGPPAAARWPAIACIGPVTAAAARVAGLPVAVVASEYTLDGLVAALVDYFAVGRPPLGGDVSHTNADRADQAG